MPHRVDHQFNPRLGAPELVEVNLSGKDKAKQEPPPQSRAQLLFQGQLSAKKKRKIIRLEQWVEVRIENGKTVTVLIPSNEKLIRKGQHFWPVPEYVYRRFNFPFGVPDEYAWTCEMTPEIRECGGMGIQRMTVDDWLDMIEEEKERTDGHVGPAPNGNLPRPPEHGDCDCPVCSFNRKILEEEAAADQAEKEAAAQHEDNQADDPEDDAEDSCADGLA